MRCYYYSYIFITSFYLSLNVIFGSIDHQNNNRTVFVPTREWQVVNKGTPIPKGLHVRHNFQTGITEAKLLEQEDEENNNDLENSVKNSVDRDTQKSLAIHPDAKLLSGILESDSSDKFQRNDEEKGARANISASELRTKLKTIKSMKKKSKDKEKDFFNVNESDEINDNNYKTMIKFGKSTIDEVDNLKIFIQQFASYKESITSVSLNTDETKIVIDILSQLEYLVHDIDNGLEFVKLGGISKVIYPCLNETVNEEIKSEALRVLGATVQSNPKVKDAVLELDVIERILNTLKISKFNSKLSDRCLYALGSLVRNYPAGQKRFLTNDGLKIFSKFLELDGPLSTQKRILNLINDLTIEGQHSNESIKEYKEIEFDNNITNDVKLCDNIANFLIQTTRREITNIKKDIITADNDLLETIYRCAFTLVNICKYQFKLKLNDILPAINNITLFYNDFNKSNLDNNHDDNYYHYEDMLIIVKKFKNSIVDNKSFNDEL